MRVVSDSSPLIYLSKLNRLGLLKQLYGTIAIPRKVFEEVVERGKKEGYKDALAVEEAIAQKWITVHEAKHSKNLLLLAPEIDEGEAQALSLALNTKARTVLIDDATARSVARSLGLNPRGTAYAILLAMKKGLVTKKEAKKLFQELIQAGFRIAPELYAQLLEEIENA